MQKRKYLTVSLLLLVFCFPLVSQDQDQLTNLSSTIKERLIDLKVQSANMTLLCETLQKDLETSQIEASQWKEQSTMLSDSLTSINEQLMDSYETITKYEQQLKTGKKVVLALAIVLLIMIAAKVLGYILYAKGIKVPRWLDILL